MANIVLVNPLTMIGGVPLRAAGLIAASAAETGVQIRSTQFTVYAAWTACEIDTGNEIYMVTVEGQNAAGTWVNLGVLMVLGATAAIGEGDAPATGSVKASFNNPYGGLVRIHTWVKGTIATGLNFSASAFPIANLAY